MYCVSPSNYPGGAYVCACIIYNLKPLKYIICLIDNKITNIYNINIPKIFIFSHQSWYNIVFNISNFA